MKLVFTLQCALWAFTIQGQLLVRVTSIPSSTPEDANIHMTGNFNNWNPGDPNFQLTTNEDGSKTISLFPQIGKVEYKFTRGSWESAEGGIKGSYTPNRSYEYDGKPSVVDVAILSWEDLDGNCTRKTSCANVHLLDHNFSIPQLERERRIWIYLPPDYEYSTKRYPVIYMQDGQNLFDEVNAAAGEWKVDETLNHLFETGDHGAIVIGIESGGWRRLDEYSPWYNTQLEAGGEGGDYVDFIVHTLKPYVDATYRTLSERDYTCIMGSSMGGLIAHYAMMEYQDVFGKAAVFSPSFWFSDNSYTHTQSKGKKTAVKYYTSVGQKEGADMVNGVTRMFNALKYAGFETPVEMKKVINPNGNHNEASWSDEFRSAYTWLFSEVNFESLDYPIVTPIRIRPNPAYSELWVDNMDEVEGAEIQIISIDGKLVRRFSLESNSPVNIRSVTEGMHIVNIIMQNRVIYSEKIIVARG